jgi:DNA repair protein RadC
VKQLQNTILFSILSPVCMRKERHHAKQEPPTPSLRDYWVHPTGQLERCSPQTLRRRREPPALSTPSLWGLLPDPAEPLTTAPREQIGDHLPVHPELLHPADRTAHVFEQLLHHGLASLSDAQLLSVALHLEGEEHQRLERLLASSSLQQMLHVDPAEMSKQFGLEPAQAAQLHAILEVARRLLLPPATENYQIRTAADAARLVMPEMAFLDHEEMRVLLLDTKNYVVANLRLYQGTVNSSVLRTSEIYKPAVARNSPHIILCHNHPSGNPEPSPEDVAVTQQLIEAGNLLDIELLDHLIIGQHPRFVSLREIMKW